MYVSDPLHVVARGRLLPTTLPSLVDFPRYRRYPAITLNFIFVSFISGTSRSARKPSFRRSTNT